jgi:hypothetical protein
MGGSQDNESRGWIMANYRQVHTKIWKDRWFLDLEPEHKLLFIYLFSNERASISGIYELPKKVIAFETGLNEETLENGLQIFEEAQKAFVWDGVVWVKNLRKYHETSSPKVQTRILSDIDEVKDCELKAIYCQEYGIDRVSDIGNGVGIPPSKLSIVKSSKVKSGGDLEETNFLRFCPEYIATGDFLTAWGEWEQYHIDKNQPLTAASAKRQLSDMGKWGVDRAIAAIDYSIKQNYTGLVEPKTSQNGTVPLDADPYFDNIKPVGGLY